MNAGRLVHSFPSTALPASGIMGIISACETSASRQTQAPLCIRGAKEHIFNETNKPLTALKCLPMLINNIADAHRQSCRSASSKLPMGIGSNIQAVFLHNVDLQSYSQSYNTYKKAIIFCKLIDFLYICTRFGEVEEGAGCPLLLL